MVALEDSDFAVLGDSIDLNQVSALPVANTVAYVKQATFVMVQQLNRFSKMAEGRLCQISASISRLETELTILESKLVSIPGLESVKANADDASGPPGQNTEKSLENPVPQPRGSPSSIPAPAPAPPAISASPSPGISSAPPVPPVTAAPQAPPSPDPTVVTVQNDPVYSKYFKMMRMGVPAAAVKLKMQSEGLNPHFLDTPSAPSPSGSAPGKTQDDTASEASSSDDSD